MTKSQQIMALYDGKRTTAEIAQIVGCRPEYVRVVARQRKGKGESDIDRRYRQKAWPYGDRKAARRASRIRYKTEIAKGTSVVIATGRAGSAYKQVMLRTGTRAAASLEAAE